MSLNDLGDVPANSVLPLFWTSHDLATGATETMSGLATTDIEVYKGTSVTQRSSDAGYALIDTDGLDIDATTGLNGISIDLSDNTDAGFYAVGSFYNVVVGPVTIDAQTVTIHLATFRIVAAEAITGKPKVDVDGWLGTAAATPTVNGVPEVDLTHVAGSTTSVSTIASSIATLLADIGGVATAAADGDPTSTDLLFAYVKQILNVLMGSAGIVAWPAAAAPANAVSIAEGLRWLADQVGTAGAGLTAADDAVIAAIPSAATNAAAVWDLDATGHQTGGTFGQAIGDPAADTNTIYGAVVTGAAGATVAADVIAVKSDTAAILTDTADMQPKLGTPAVDVSADIAAVKVDTAAILVDTGTTLDGRIPAALVGGKMDSNVGAISGDTVAADTLEALMDGVIVAQVNDVGATTTVFIADGFTEATNDHFNGRLITFISGALSGQQTAITDYVGATQTITVTALTEAPANNDFFVIH